MNGLFSWSIIGVIVFLFSTQTLPPPINLAETTRAQRVFLYVVCGPFMWVYGIWCLLGYVGKRS